MRRRRTLGLCRDSIASCTSSCLACRPSVEIPYLSKCHDFLESIFPNCFINYRYFCRLQERLMESCCILFNSCYRENLTPIIDGGSLKTAMPYRDSNDSLTLQSFDSNLSVKNPLCFTIPDESEHNSEFLPNFVKRTNSKLSERLSPTSSGLSSMKYKVNESRVSLHPHRNSGGRFSFTLDWSDLLKEYHELELEMTEKYQDLLTPEVLENIRLKPESYLSAENPEFIRELAKRRVEIEENQNLVLMKGIKSKRSVESTENSESTEINDDDVDSFTQDSALPSAAGNANALSIASTNNRISSRWARNLSSIVPVQGAMRFTNKTNILNVKPKWPEWLVDESFDVIKVNSFGKKYQRTLKLTEQHILALKDGTGVTKVYTYLDVLKLSLSSDSKSVTLLFKSDNRSYTYITAFACHICQQITTRVQVRTALEKSSLSVSNIEHSTEAMLAIIDAISTDNAKSGTSNYLTFAKTLKNRLLPTQNDENVGKDDTADTNPGAESTLSHSFLKIEPGTAEFKVQSAVRNFLYDENTPEGNTRRHFIATFKQEQGLTDIRMWIEGMHEYIFMNRGVQLSAVYYNTASYGLVPTSDLNDIDENTLVSISFIIFTVIEESIFTHLNQNILTIIQTPELIKRENTLVSKMNELAKRSQGDWGIPKDNISSLGWKSAIFELEGVERNPTPSTKLNAIVRAAKAIYAEYKNEVIPRLSRKGKHDAVLGADDLVPIFIFVLCRSGLLHPIFNKDLLWGLCHPDQLYGESGYYLTIYESAVAYVEETLNDAAI